MSTLMVTMPIHLRSLLMLLPLDQSLKVSYLSVVLSSLGCSSLPRASLLLAKAPCHLRIPAILLPWTSSLEYRVVYGVEDIHEFHDGRCGEGTNVYTPSALLKGPGIGIALQIHDPLLDLFEYLILE